MPLNSKVGMLLQGRDRWVRQRTFVMAGVGAVVGFANIWTFPSLMAEYGGLAFLIAYTLALLTLTLPLAVLEIGLGRYVRRNPVDVLQSVGGQGTGFSLWRWTGGLMVIAALLTVVVYSLVAGMGLSYALKSAFSEFQGIEPGAMPAVLSALQQNTTVMIIWLSVFIGLVFLISVKGVYHGLEKAMLYIVPLMFAMLAVMLIYSARYGDLGGALSYLFSFESVSLSWAGVLAAYKYAFFSLSIGAGVMMVLGAYMPNHGKVGRSVLIISFADLLVGAVAGLVVLSWLLKAELPPDQGFSLIFQSLPLALGQLPMGSVFGVLFFIFFTLAAWSSAVFLIEPGVAWLQERYSLSRVSAASITHVALWGLGALLVMSMAGHRHWQLAGIPLFSLLQFVVSTILLPVAGCLLTVLCGYVLPYERLAQALRLSPEQRLFRWGYPLLRYFCVPVLIVIQISMVFDLLLHSCEFTAPKNGGLCSEEVVSSSKEVLEEAEPEEVDLVKSAPVNPEVNVENVEEENEVAPD
ncbi:sodium-dependent transporter [Hahella sp. CR1]|uniref:sodium-dependent transporter n=1 Tax=Hahella sp. CR1 TaxID=2992807 RepID=UPI0024423CAC|nr:sodium-dependent transporter [Hahella sp. CR1]MDG9669980.1 sodium-dependent transporter [Hahella sp. CR1]